MVLLWESSASRWFYYEKLVHVDGFIMRNLSWCTITCMSNYVANFAFFVCLFLSSSVAYIFIAHNVWRNTDKICVLVHSPFCVMNFTLPACRPNSAAVSSTTQDAEQGWTKDVRSWGWHYFVRGIEIEILLFLMATILHLKSESLCGCRVLKNQEIGVRILVKDKYACFLGGVQTSSFGHSASYSRYLVRYSRDKAGWCVNP